jgi:uncharacterized protein (DUF1330 family)
MHGRRIMPAYIIGRIHVRDKAQYAEYIKATPAIIAKYGGHFIARGGETAVLEGPEETGRVVIIEFPAMNDAKAFFHSEEYAEAKKLREGAAVAQFVVIDGVAAR